MVNSPALRRITEGLSRSLLKCCRYRHPVVTRAALGLVTRQPSFGLSKIDRKIVQCLGNQARGYFVELGANNGVSQANTLLLETYFQWRGTLIEPVLATYEELLSNRNRRRNRLVRAACVSFEYPEPHVHIAKSNLMSAPLGVESDLADPLAHAKKGLKHVRGQDEVHIELAPARTLTAILDEAKAPSHIDLLSLDVEGGEIEVLKGVDFQRYSFGMMVIESRNPEKLEKFLNMWGYELVEKISDRDYLVKHTGLA